MAVTPTAAVELTWVFEEAAVSTPQDLAEFTIWMQDESGGPMSQFDMDNLALNGADSWGANVSTALWTDAIALKWCQARVFNADGTTLRVSQKPPTAFWTGSADPPSLPWETSLCVSEYAYQPGTFTLDSRRKRGRFYLPPMGAVCLNTDNTGRIKDATLPTILAEMKVFYNALGANPGDGDHSHPVVFSRKDSDLYPVTYLRVDGKIDSQRRRENRETATVLTTAL